MYKLFASLSFSVLISMNAYGNSAEEVRYKDKLNPAIEQTIKSFSESMASIESELASILEKKAEEFLRDEEIQNSLIKLMKHYELSDKSTDHGQLASMALSALYGTLRLSPGVMDNAAIINRALLLSQAASFYSKKNPSMCRYIPNDFNLILNIDAEWISGVDETILTKAIEDESKGVKLILKGILPRNINNHDRIIEFSSFANTWLAGLDEKKAYNIAIARENGNYCELWSYLLKDLSEMSLQYPMTINKVLAPMMVMTTRGWLDSGRWAGSENVKLDN